MAGRAAVSAFPAPARRVAIGYAAICDWSGGRRGACAGVFHRDEELCLPAFAAGSVIARSSQPDFVGRRLFQRDTQKRIGAAQPPEFRRPPFEEDAVAELDGIITLLEEASGEDLSHFRIPAERMTRRVIGAQRGSYGGGPGRVDYADKKHCEDDYFRSQLSGLASYVTIIRGPKPVDKTNPYDSLSDDQLKEILTDRKLKPKRIIDERGEHYAFERAHAIATLLKGDNPPTPTSISNVFHIRDSNVVHSSPGSMITQSTGVKGEELQKIIADLKHISASQELSPENRAQMNVNIGTIELQISSPQPNKSIIKSSLESAVAILEHAVGIVIGESVLIGIKMHLGAL